MLSRVSVDLWPSAIALRVVKSLSFSIIAVDNSLTVHFVPPFRFPFSIDTALRANMAPLSMHY